LTAGSFNLDLSDDRGHSESAVEIVQPPIAADGAIAADEAPGLLELRADMEAALPRLAIHMERLTEGSVAISETMVQSTEEVNSSDGTAKAKLVIAVKLAGELSRFADETEAIVLEYDEDIVSADAGVRSLFEQMSDPEDGDVEFDVIEGALQAAVQAGDAAKTLSDTISSTEPVLKNLGLQARPLKRVTSRLVGAYKLHRGSLAIMQSWGDEAARLLDDLQ
jgi:hypothetical protein